MGILVVPKGYHNPAALRKEVPMSATVSLGPLYQFPGWVVNKVSISSNGDEVCVHLRPDRQRKGFRCPAVHRTALSHDEENAFVNLRMCVYANCWER